mgnify:CR=1 FL=1
MRCFLHLRGNPENLKRSAVSMINMVKLPTKKSNLFLRVAKGHFATSHSHINYYIDVTTQKSRLSEAKAVAKELVAAYQHSTIVDTVLCLDGTGSTGGITTLPLSLGSSDWTQARMWVHFSGGTVQPRLNGQELPLHRAGRDKTVTGIRCSEYEFLWEGKGSGAAQIQLELTCGSGGEMKVYDYCLAFF